MKHKLKKGDKISIELEMHQLNQNELIELYENEIFNILDGRAVSFEEVMFSLKKLTEQNEFLKKNINNIIQSKSWRLTKPLRFIRNKMVKTKDTE